MTDIELMLELKNGNKEAFDTLVKRHQLGLYNFFYRLQGNITVAEDLAQDVFLKIYIYAKRYENRAKFTTYLYRIAKNTWIDYIKKLSTRQQIVSLDCQNENGFALYTQLEAKENNPVQNVVINEKVAEIQKAIAKLPEKQRLTFVLVEVQELSYAEAAEVLEIPVGTVKSRMFNAVFNLRESLRYMQCNT